MKGYWYWSALAYLSRLASTSVVWASAGGCRSKLVTVRTLGAASEPVLV